MNTTQSFKNANHPATLLFRALSAGVLLSLALIHVIVSGISDLNVVSDFPIGGCCVVAGILLMVIMENLSHHFMSQSKFGGLHTHGDGGSDGGDSTHAAPHGHSASHQHLAPHEHSVSHEHAALEALDVDNLFHDNCHINLKDGDMEAGAGPSVLADATSDGHTHGCVAANTAANCWASQQTSQAYGTTIRQQVTAYMFELGCVVHSFLVGELKQERAGDKHDRPVSPMISHLPVCTMCSVLDHAF